MDIQGIDIQIEKKFGHTEIIIDGLRFNRDGLHSLRKLAERKATVTIWIDDHGALTIQEAING